MVITTLLLLVSVMVVCLVGVAITPRFDRRARVAQRPSATEPDPRATRSVLR